MHGLTARYQTTGHMVKDDMLKSQWTLSCWARALSQEMGSGFSVFSLAQRELSTLLNLIYGFGC